MDARQKFSRFLRQEGLRRTPQREYILSAFLRIERHISVQDLFEAIHKKHPDIGYATVWRTVKLFVKANLCSSVDFGDGIERFEHKYKHDHHDHLICTECGQLKEIISPKLEKLQEKLVQEHGYAQVWHRLQIKGICPKCQNKKKPGRKRIR